MIYRLIILNGDRRNEHITITPTPMTIGRAATCEIRLNDPEIAMNHAEIVHKPDGLHIRDLGSMNRLLINHKEVRDTYPNHGDVLEIGHTRALIQAYVQAEVQGEEDEDEKAERRKSWLIASGLIIFVVGLLFFIPRCERHITAPRVYEGTTEASDFYLEETKSKSKRASAQSRKTAQPATPEPAVATTPAKQPSAAVPPPPKTETAPVQTDPVLSNSVPVNIPGTNTPPPAPPETAPQPKPAPAPAAPQTPPPQQHADKPHRTPKPNPSSELILAAQKELEEATRALHGNKPAAPPAPTTSPPAAPQRTPLTPPAASTTPPAPANATPTDPTAKPPAPLPSGSVIKIINTDMIKFPETDKFQEMRLLTIHLAAKEAERELNPDAVRVEVVFAEKNPTTGQINPALPGGTPADLTVQGKWPGTEQKTVVASYIVPVSPTTTNYLSQYHGYIIRVYYQGALQDELSQPKDLPR